jgi:hypothetical protein
MCTWWWSYFTKQHLQSEHDQDRDSSYLHLCKRNLKVWCTCLLPFPCNTHVFICKNDIPFWILETSLLFFLSCCMSRPIIFLWKIFPCASEFSPLRTCTRLGCWCFALWRVGDMCLGILLVGIVMRLWDSPYLISDGIPTYHGDNLLEDLDLSRSPSKDLYVGGYACYRNHGGDLKGNKLWFRAPLEVCGDVTCGGHQRQWDAPLWL